MQPFKCSFCRSSHANGCDRSTSCTSALWRLLYLTVAFRSRVIPDSLLRTSGTYSAGWSSLVARRAHNPEVVGSNPAPATKKTQVRWLIRLTCLLCNRWVLRGRCRCGADGLILHEIPRLHPTADSMRTDLQ